MRLTPGSKLKWQPGHNADNPELSITGTRHSFVGAWRSVKTVLDARRSVKTVLGARLWAFGAQSKLYSTLGAQSKLYSALGPHGARTSLLVRT